MKDQNCGYCMKNELLDPFGIFICELDASVVVLFKEQALSADVSRVAKAIHAIFHPNKINYGAFGDSSGHMHFHLVPKYKDQFEWNGVFQMNPEKTFLSDAEYAGIIQKIKAELGV